MKTIKGALTAEDICKIIEVSSKARVSKVYIGNLRLEFAILDDETPKKATRPTESLPDKAMSDEDHEKQNKEALVSAEIDLRESQAQDMLIEDPYQREQMILSGELDEELLEESDE